MYREEVGFFERIISALSYFTFGTVGFIYLLIAFFTKTNLKNFLRFHIFQSIFISILYFIVSTLLMLVMQILSVIPIINQIANRIYFWLNMPIVFNLSIVNTLIDVVLLYLIIMCLKGSFGYIPWVSDIIRENIRR
jgi:hypothetical protein